MKDQRLEINDIVKNIDDAISGMLDVPEFQRKFVWKPEQVKNFVDSLWKDYPVGALLLWESEYASPQSAMGTQSSKQWIVDGQQRVTALSLLFGRKPYWWLNATAWNKCLKKYDVMVDITSEKDSLEFALPNPAREKSPKWIPVRKILTTRDLSQLTTEILNKLEMGQQSFNEIYEKLQSIKNIAKRYVYAIIVNHEIEDVAEIFTRLNMAGTKIKESDVIIALTAAKQEGWVREQFNPFLSDLGDRGFAIGPGVLIRALGIIGKGTARLKDIPKNFWDKSIEFDQAWNNTREAVIYVVRNLTNYGILSAELLPSLNALIPLFYLYDQFKGRKFEFKRAFYWFLMASWDGRYSGSAITILDQDLRTIRESKELEEAIKNLLKPFDVANSFTEEDFLLDYRESEFMRLIFYLTMFHRKAKDWLHQDIPIGYDKSDNALNEGFEPEWHHFFPKSILRKASLQEDRINPIANIVVLNEKANRKFRSKLPEQYLSDFQVSSERLVEQCVPLEKELWRIQQYEDFLKERAKQLSRTINEFVISLKEG